MPSRSSPPRRRGIAAAAFAEALAGAGVSGGAAAVAVAAATDGTVAVGASRIAVGKRALLLTLGRCCRGHCCCC